MGGLGSGRQVYSQRYTVEQLPALDVRALVRSGALLSNATGSFECMDGRVRGYLRRSANGFDLSYRISQAGGHVEDVTERVPLTRTPCHFGGWRRWFCCPGCGKRVAILYFGGRFRCRKCYRLVYASQRMGEMARMEWKANKVIRRLGGTGADGEPFPLRPKGMHRSTYRRLRERVDEADRRWVQLAQEGLVLLARRTRAAAS